MYEFKLPDVGEGLHEATIGRWLVQEGDVLRQDEPMVEIETDKALVEIPSPVAGHVAALRVAEGELVAVGTIIVVLEPLAKVAKRKSNRDDVSRVSEKKTTEALTTRPQIGVLGPNKRVLASPTVRKLALELKVDLAHVKGSGTAGRILASDVQSTANSPEMKPDTVVVKSNESQQATRVLAAPAVRKMARELGIDLAQVNGTAAGGRVLPEDVERYVNVQQKQPVIQSEAATKLISQPATDSVRTPSMTQPISPRSRDRLDSQSVEHVPLRGLRKRIAQRMEEAWRIPHVTSFEEMDASQLVALRQRFKPLAAQKDTRLTYLPFIIKIALQVLKENPYFNAVIDMQKEEILVHHAYHIGIATAIPEGLVVPVLRHAEQMSILEIARQLARLSDLAPQRKLPPNELSGSTFTITNFGSFNSYMGTPIINPPEVAILGCGRITKKPVVINDQIEIRSILPIALSYDHRLLDGAAAGKFLARLRELIEDPSKLLLELI